MKKIILVLSILIMLSSCGVFKKSAKDTAEEKTEVKTEKTVSEKEKKKQKEKEFEKRRKEKAEEQKRANKEFEKKKKQEEKEKKKKEKEQDKLIKNSAKTERQRIKEERRKEKETLLSSQKLAEQEEKEKERIQKELDKQEEKRIKEEEKLEQKLAKQKEKEEKSTIEDEQERKKEELRKKIELLETEKKQKEEEERKYFESLSTMDQIVYRMQHPEQDSKEETEEESSENKKEFDINNYTDEDVIALSDKEKKKILASKDEKQEGNFFKRTYRKAFPKKVSRKTAYPKMYKEEPKTILVLYPWNRSEYNAASEMAYTSCVKELTQKGYYVPSAIAFMEAIKKDTLLSAHYITADKIKECKTLYNADAVLLLTIYRVEKPWWSTNINVVAHYDLISTSTNDTLFTRHADFNYDSPMPVKNKNNDKLINDPEISLYLGLFEQMQKYVLLDMPVGPYHNNYKNDENKRSQPKEKKYKVNIKPS